MNKLDEIKKELSNQVDDIDNLLNQLMDLKKSQRGHGAQKTFNSKCTKEIDRYLKEINNETQIPKN
tara:strand:+ start:2273 stop:2470 length:198 start_codon:yes stop_codon:yes gene_type:complete